MAQICPHLAFRISFGYFGLRNFYNLNQADPVAGTYLGWQPTGQKPWGWPNDSTGLMNMESPYNGNPGMAIDNGIFCNSTTGDAWGCQMQYLYDRMERNPRSLFNWQE